MGRGALRETNRTCPLRFNPHVSRRRDCKLSARIAGDHDIRQMQHGIALFQSRRRVRCLSPDQQVLIHAFEREQGHNDVEIEQKYCVSIHAVHGGTTDSRIFGAIFSSSTRPARDATTGCSVPDLDARFNSRASREA